VAHTCNSSYSGGRDQEDLSSKPAWANSSQDPISKNPSQKRGGGVAQGVVPEFKPQYHAKKKKGKEGRKEGRKEERERKEGKKQKGRKISKTVALLMVTCVSQIPTLYSVVLAWGCLPPLV
jgi:hypothetical protein